MKKQMILLLSALTGAGIGAVTVGKIFGARIQKAEELADKHMTLFLLLNQWLHIKQEGTRSIINYLESHNFRTIAVYGMSFVGERLVEELRGSKIKIAYGIDQNAQRIYSDIKVITLEEPLEKVDAVIVTAICFMDQIEKNLNGRLSCPVISLEDLLYDV